MKRELSPATTKKYRGVLRAAFGGPDQLTDFKDADVSTWSESTLSALRAAVLDAGERRPAVKARASAVLEAIPARFVRKTRREMPSEDDQQIFFAHLRRYEANRYVVAFSLLRELGFRAEEFLMLEREKIGRALKGGDLLFVRKGGNEETLPIKHAKDLFQALMNFQRAPAQNVTQEEIKAGTFRGPWEKVYQVYSARNPRTAYNKLNRVCIDAAQKTSAPELWSPHLLRHLFASAMIARGAPVPVVQRALGHKSYQTTVNTYVHVNTATVADWISSKKDKPTK